MSLTSTVIMIKFCCMDEIHFDRGSELAAARRKAYAAYRRLDFCGHPVLNSVRVAAYSAWQIAVQAEREYWNKVRGEHSQSEE